MHCETYITFESSPMVNRVEAAESCLCVIIISEYSLQNAKLHEDNINVMHAFLRCLS